MNSYRVFKMSKKSKMDVNTLVQQLILRSPRAVTEQDLRHHIQVLCEKVPIFFNIKQFGSLKVFEMTKDTKINTVKQILEEKYDTNTTQ